MYGEELLCASAGRLSQRVTCRPNTNLPGGRAEPGKHERLNDQKETNRHDNIKDNTRKSHLHDIDMEDKSEEGIPQSSIQAEIKGSGEVPYPGRRYFRNGILPLTQRETSSGEVFNRSR